MKTATFEARVKSRKAVVGIVGMGYVGLPLARTFGKAGFPIVAIVAKCLRRQAD